METRKFKEQVTYEEYLFVAEQVISINKSGDVYTVSLSGYEDSLYGPTYRLIKEDTFAEFVMINLKGKHYEMTITSSDTVSTLIYLVTKELKEKNK